ncbi:MAG: hypothetical protein ABIH50_03675 [bacterium]
MNKKVEKYLIAVWLLAAVGLWGAGLWLAGCGTVSGSASGCGTTYTGVTAGGCSITLVKPANGEEVTLPYRFEWTTNGGCTTPYKFAITGNPPGNQGGTEKTWSLSVGYVDPYDNGSYITANNGALWLQAADLANAGVTSTDGCYQWTVSNSSQASYPSTYSFKAK